jgi:hypothetical protein
VFNRSRSQYAAAASSAGVPAIISAGIYPGTSNIMAAHMISISRKEYDDEWKLLDTPGITLVNDVVRVLTNWWIKAHRPLHYYLEMIF